MTSQGQWLSQFPGKVGLGLCPVLYLLVLLFREALTGSNWVLPGPHRTGKTMSTVKFKNRTIRREGWKGQMTKYSAECLGANKKRWLVSSECVDAWL